MASVKRAAPDVTLDGALVEKMSPKGIELMVGAKRDPGWGAVLLLGLGGIWVEALGDVQLLPGDADEEQIVEALRKLRSAKLLAGFRGAPPADIEAVAQDGHGHRPADADHARVDRDRRQSADGARQGPGRDRTRRADRHGVIAWTMLAEREGNA